MSEVEKNAQKNFPRIEDARRSRAYTSFSGKQKTWAPQGGAVLNK
jgi:hypothetical protein